MNFLQTVEADAKAALVAVEAGLTHLEAEAKTVVAWVEKEVPGAAGAAAMFMQQADAAAAELAKIAANGLGSEVAAVVDSAETLVLNLLQSSHLTANAQGSIKAIDVSAAALVNTIGQKAISVALATVLSKLAPLAAAAL